MDDKLKQDLEKDNLAKKIAGEIVLADSPGTAIQKWRNVFKISQRELADQMHLMPSVISDYESGRRKSPGVKMIKKIVDSILKIDNKKGKTITNEFNNLYSDQILSDAILDIKETTEPFTIDHLTKLIEGKIINETDNIDKPLYGYTIIDSIKAITNLSPHELEKLYGVTTQRAMIFTKVERGRSPMIAIKVTNLRPGAIILHGLKELDPIAERIAKVENIPLIVSELSTVDELITRLKKSI